MKHVQLYVPDDPADVLSQLDDWNVDYVRTQTVTGEGELVQFPLPDEAVDDVLHALSERGLSDDAYTVVDESSTATGPNLDQLQQTFTDELSGQLSEEHLRDRAAEHNPNWLTFVGMAALSAVIVAGGLLRNSAAAVAGAMVIAPYFGTALSISTGIVTDDRFLFFDGLRYLTVGVTVSVLSAAVAGRLARVFDLVPSTLALTQLEQVSIFLTPTLLSVGIALAAGAAGAISFATSTKVGLSGVAIAAAIVPAAGVVGLGIAWNAPALVAGAAALLVVNLVAINAAAIPVLYVFDARASPFPTSRDSIRNALRQPRVVAAVLAVLLVVSAAGVATTQHSAFNRSVIDSVDDVLDRPEYEDLATEGVHVEYAGLFSAGEPKLVRVYFVNGDPNTYPALADTLERAIERATGHDVVVYVHFSTYYGGETSPESDPTPTNE